jgi:type-F conjugative transfer system secretin TraK
MKNKLTKVILMIVPIVVFAGNKPEKINFENGETFKVNLSRFDYNRVIVHGEKIIKARYAKGSYQVDTSEVEDDEDDGAVYLKPVMNRVSTMYISTNKGHTFGIEGVQDDIPGRSFDFSFKKTFIEKPIKTTNTIKRDILHDARVGVTPVGFKKIDDYVSITNLNRYLKASLINHYVNGNKEVYKYQITNNSNKVENIPYTAIKTPEVIRYFIGTDKLKPKSSTILVSLVSKNQGVKNV